MYEALSILVKAKPKQTAVLSIGIDPSITPSEALGGGVDGRIEGIVAGLSR
jgi:hypothetical protein